MRDFRFKVEHVGLLPKLLELPRGRMIAERSRYNASSIEATALLPRRLPSSTRWSDVELAFGRSKSALPGIFLETLKNAYSFFRGRQGGFSSGFVESRLDLYARKIRGKGAPLSCCVGFIDETAIRIESY